MSVPILTARLRAKDDTGTTLNNMRNSISRSLTSIGRIAAGILARDVVQGFVSATKEGALLAGKVQTLQAAFTRFTQAAGVEDMTLEKLRRAVQGTVGDVGLLTAANNAMALGLPVDRLNDLFSAAMSVGHAMGRTTLQAIDDVATGIGRQSRLILDNLGIIVDAEYANKQYAATLGKVASELTEQERKQAFIGVAMEALMQKAVLLEGTTSDLQIQYEQWGASVENLKRKLGEIFLPILTSVTDKMLDVITTTENVIEAIKQGDWSGAWQQIKNAFGNIRIGLSTTGFDVDWQTIWDNIKTWWSAVDWGQLFTNLGTFVENLWDNVIYPGLQTAADISSQFLKWFGEVDWGTVFDSMEQGMAKFWPTFKKAVGDLTTLYLEWFSSVDWGKVFSGMVDFAAEFNKFFYEQLEQFQDAIAGGFWGSLWKWITGGSAGKGWGGGGDPGRPEYAYPQPTLDQLAQQMTSWGGTASMEFHFHIENLIGDEEATKVLGTRAAQYAIIELRRRGIIP